MEREQNNRQSSNNSVDSASSSNNHQNFNDEPFDFGWISENYQHSNDVDFVPFLNSNHQNGSFNHNLTSVVHQQPPNPLHPSSAAVNSHSLLQNTVIGLNRLSINGFDNVFQETEYRPFMPFVRNRAPSNIAIGDNRLPSINTRRSSTANGFDYASANGNNNYGVPGFGLKQNVMDYLSECATTIRGCNRLQRMLREADSETRERMITKVTADLRFLMVHEIGFQFAQTVFGLCSEEQLFRVLQSVMIDQRHFVDICNDNYGKEAVKTLIENLRTDEQRMAVTAVLKNHICSFTNFSNTQHVLLFYINASNDFIRKSIFNEMARHCLAIGTNRMGCVILQHCICRVHIESNIVRILILSIILYSHILSDDIYGNYVVQHVVLSRIDGVTGRIVRRLEGKFSEIAKSKYGSNVVEKCLEVGGEGEVVKIAVELMNSPQLPEIAQHPFGNYVIQAALQQLHLRGMEGLYSNFVKRINAHSSDLLTHLFGRTVMNKIRKLMRNSKWEKRFF